MPKTYAPIVPVDLGPFQDLGSTRVPTIILPKDIDELITEACNQISKSEWLSFGFVERIGTCTWVVTNLVIPDSMSCSAGEANINMEDFAAIRVGYLKEQAALNPLMGNWIDWNKKLRFWVHSHHNMPAYWSTTDHTAIEELGGHGVPDEGPSGDRWFTHMVVNNEGARVAMFSANRPFPLKVDLKVVVADTYILRPNVSGYLTTIKQANASMNQKLEFIKAKFAKDVQALRVAANEKYQEDTKAERDAKEEAVGVLTTTRELVTRTNHHFAGSILAAVKKAALVEPGTFDLDIHSICGRGSKRNESRSERASQSQGPEKEVSQIFDPAGEVQLVGAKGFTPQETKVMINCVSDVFSGDRDLLSALREAGSDYAPDPDETQRKRLTSAGITSRAMVVCILKTISSYTEADREQIAQEIEDRREEMEQELSDLEQDLGERYGIPGMGLGGQRTLWDPPTS